MKNLASFLTHTLRNWHVPILTIAIAVGIAVCSTNGIAQSGAGSIQGTITDSTGAVIPGAIVHVVNQATAVAADTKSNSVGLYQVPGLFTGTYTITFTAAGMKTNKETVELLVDQNAVINTTLTAGAVTQQVEVNADAVQLTTNDSGTVAATLENARINQLPLDQRLLLTLAQETTPGLEADGSNPGARANGLMDQGMDYVQDGATLTNRNFGGERNSPQGQLPDPDSVQEMKMDMSNSSAEFSGPATGIITTKSGTNSIHGTMFETARNAGFGLAKGRGFVTTPTADADPPLVRNEFGFSAGGPLVLPHIYHGKDRTFWFGSYERYSLRSWAPLLVSVPTQAMKGGDFSQLTNSNGQLQQLYDPLTTYNSGTANCPGTDVSTANPNGVPNAYCRTQFAYNGVPNTINPARLSPFSKIIYAHPSPGKRARQPGPARAIQLPVAQHQQLHRALRGHPPGSQLQREEPRVFALWRRSHGLGSAAQYPDCAVDRGGYGSRDSRRRQRRHAMAGRHLQRGARVHAHFLSELLLRDGPQPGVVRPVRRSHRQREHQLRVDLWYSQQLRRDGISAN